VPQTCANDLAGTVVDEAGKPVADATVIVLSAAARTGRPTKCPGCYEDCGRTTTSGPDGQYVMLELDATLAFRVAAVADGRRANIIDNVIPQDGPTNFILPATAATLPPECRVRGRVVDPAGKPIAGAVIEPIAREQGTRTTFGALTRFGVDAYAVTNEKGEFVITSTEPADAYYLDVKAPRFAPKRFQSVPVGDDVERNKLAVDEGGTVRGRLVQEGQPAEGITVGACHIDRSSRIFAGHFETTSDAEGKFEFLYLPKVDFYLYSLMSNKKGQGSLPIDFVPLAAADRPHELGDIALGPSHPVAGRIVLTDRPQLLGGATLRLGREGAWDSQQQDVGPDGAFRFDDVPNDESVTLEVRIAGYRLSQQNRFQQVRETGVALHVDQPREDIELIFEPDPNPPATPAAAPTRGRRGRRGG
jgi:hypothetical protein